MAGDFLKEAEKVTGPHKKQLESLANMLKTDATKLGNNVGGAVAGVASAVAPAAVSPVAGTTTDNPLDSPLAPKVGAHKVGINAHTHIISSILRIYNIYI